MAETKSAAQLSLGEMIKENSRATFRKRWQDPPFPPSHQRQ